MQLKQLAPNWDKLHIESVGELSFGDKGFVNVYLALTKRFDNKEQSMGSGLIDFNRLIIN